MRPSRVLATFCCLTIKSCCSAKAFFWLISCKTCRISVQLMNVNHEEEQTFCKASFGIDILSAGVWGKVS